MADVKRVYVDAGHDNGSNPGAVAYEREGNLNIKVTNYMCAYLTDNYVCEVYKDITADDIDTICAKANKWGADLFVSNHFNAAKGDGYEALVYDSNNRALGQIFEKHVKAVGQNSRGVKYRPDLGVLRLTSMPAVLNEGAFVDNWNDIKDWNDDAELKVLGTAYAKAAAEYLKLPAKEKPAPKPTPQPEEKKVDGLYLVRVSGEIDIYKAPLEKNGKCPKGAYTIVEEKAGFGKLKSSTEKNPRWIDLSKVKKI